ncbi:unnamed protein product [Paramecium octaurelia]|uniref:Uncharacterized protein n=1 Tax=Paramecium octaurelia TaxID=43137 RepID=A0A8S1YA87_PAROT|nr:unnamed protein product [Paramecium octaurelia]
MMNKPQNNQQSRDAYYQQQQQIYPTQKQQEEQAIIQYYIYQDFQNIMNLLFSFKQIKEYFADEPNHKAITLSYKKLIIQLNISNSIHFDLERTYQNEFAFIQDAKGKVKTMLEKLDYVIGKEHQNLIQNYRVNSLSQSVKINQLPLQQTQDFTFNENLLNQLIPQVEQIDQQIQSVKQAKYYNVPNENDIRQRADYFQALTLDRLQKSYPKNTKHFQHDSRGPQTMQQNGGNQFQNYQDIAKNPNR